MNRVRRFWKEKNLNNLVRAPNFNNFLFAFKYILEIMLMKFYFIIDINTQLFHIVTCKFNLNLFSLIHIQIK